MRPPRSPPAAEASISPRWPLHGSGLSSPISPTAPSLPSPSFPSLEQSISTSSESLARTFEKTYDKPLISPVMVGVSRMRDRSPRVAPPRPSPIMTMPPPSRSSLEAGVRTPLVVPVDAFSPGFI
ncbi:hypothetical protein G7046_g7412 [Stylonectria norvegica]|nr:hypothetical protein G7046_g7412 [Stylonectria norvegica]